MNKNLSSMIGLVLALALPASQTFASASPTETVMEFTEGSGEITSSSTGDDKMEVRQVVAEAEQYYADTAAPMGSELSQQVRQLKQQRPGLSTGQAVDFIYERALKNQ